jgi:multiple sugar transport system substrate-binding protein
MKVASTRLRALRFALLGAAAVLGPAAVSTGPAIAAGDTIKVAFSLDYFMSSPDLAKKWFAEVKTQFEAAHPGDTLELIPIPGGFDDFNTKISLLLIRPRLHPM